MPMNVALVGAGNISRAHLTALKEARNGQVVGIYDVDRARAEERASEFGVPRVYSTWNELLEDPAVQVVGVLVPPDLHARFSIEALEAGKDVVCEKPMAADLAECDAMLAAARREGRRHFTVQNRIYTPAAEKARELLESGAIGTVFLAQSNGFEGVDTVARSPWLAAKRGGNGVLMAQAVHPSYTLRWLFGEVELVSGVLGGRKVIEMAEEDTAIVTLRFASGVVAELTATFGLNQGPFDHAILLYGNEGAIQIHNQRSATHPQSLHLISPRVNGDREPLEIELPPVSGGAASFQAMWDDYLRSLETGEPARVSELDGRKAVEIILAAHRSSELGQVVKLPL